MLTTSKQPPEFNSHFLQDCSVAFRQRSKTLRYCGRLEFVHPIGEDLEWLTAAWNWPPRPSVCLKIVEDGRMHLYIESTRRRDRGKVILCLEHMRATSQGSEIVEAFKGTMHLMGREDGIRDQVPPLWRAVSMVPLGP